MLFILGNTMKDIQVKCRMAGKFPIWFLRALMLFLGVILYCCSQSQQSRKASPALAQRPNFLVIITDDQTYDTIHALNNTEIHTPNMDNLAKRGVVFTHAFNPGSWSGAVCVASRTMILTGQTLFHAARNMAYLDEWAQFKVPEAFLHQNALQASATATEVKTWPEVFAEAGYITWMTGKWHNTDRALLKGFREAISIGAGMYETFDESGSSAFAYARPNNSSWVPWDPLFKGHWTPAVKDLIYGESGNKTIGLPYTVNQHTSELYADQASRFLETRARNSDEPFFMYVAFNAPHDPRQSPREYVNMYPQDKLSLPGNFLPEHPFDQGDHMIRDEKLAPFPRTPEAVRLHRQEYYAIISHFDHEMGRILSALDQSGKAENTYIIFTSDHGLAVGRHGLMGKQNQYDHSIRMPLIIAGPGLGQGRRIEELVNMQSLFATSCDLAGLEIPESVEFRSLRSLLEGQGTGGEDYIFGAYRHFQRMIRSKEYKLIVYPEVKKVQLFDLAADPLEMNNLAEKQDYLLIKTALFNELLRKQKELGDYLTLNPDDFL